MSSDIKCCGKINRPPMRTRERSDSRCAADCKSQASVLRSFSLGQCMCVCINVSRSVCAYACVCVCVCKVVLVF